MVNIAIEFQCKKNVPDVFKTICPVLGGGGGCSNLYESSIDPSKIVDITGYILLVKLTVTVFSFHRIMGFVYFHKHFLFFFFLTVFIGYEYKYRYYKIDYYNNNNVSLKQNKKFIPNGRGANEIFIKKNYPCEAPLLVPSLEN